MQTKVNLKESVNCLTEIFKYQKVGQLNDHILYVIQGKDRTLDFHNHNADEMFYVIEGKLQIEFEDGITDLAEGDFIIVPKGTRHRPVAKSLSKILFIDKEGAWTKENSGGVYPE